MAAFKELYRLSTENAEIALNAQETFGQDTSSREAKNLYGSFNVAQITVLRATGAIISLDGTDNFVLEQPGTFSIKAEEGQYFNWVDIVDDTGVAILAAKVKVVLAIAKQVD